MSSGDDERYVYAVAEENGGFIVARNKVKSQGPKEAQLESCHRAWNYGTRFPVERLHWTEEAAIEKFEYRCRMEIEIFEKKLADARRGHAWAVEESERRRRQGR